jgi:riboflavin kinase/FMN adenylyltransferase
MYYAVYQKTRKISISLSKAMIYFVHMQLITGVRGLRPHFNQSVVTVGNFDGVHQGHQQLILQVCKKAKELRISSVVLTFEPHPIKVLFPEKNFKRLFDLNDRISNIEKINPDFLVVEPFSRKLSELDASNFFSSLLLEKCLAKSILVGHDFSFGKNRSGSLEVLKKLCLKNKIELTVLDPVKLDGETVSSTLVRSAVESGDVQKVQKLLNRPFFIEGEVIKGAGRGKKIGFATVNLLSKAELYPKLGVYISQTFLNGIRYDSVTNVGTNPTFENKPDAPVHVETHIFDFNEDIYGSQVKVEFLDYLRSEKKFSNVSDLVKQIKSDVEMARKFLR